MRATGAQIAISKSWAEILGVMESLLGILKEANVPKPLVQVMLNSCLEFTLSAIIVAGMRLV
jgi:hypothetical protein